jgi:tRNA threonylcarbamoyladenosine biosynthesis protein TsaB
MDRGQAEALMPLVEAVMQLAGLRYAELDLVAATVGPGSFTGLRIGLAAARGIGLAAGIPVTGVTSFAALAGSVLADAPEGRDLAVAIDDRRGGVYWQEFDAARQPKGEPRALDRDQLPKLLAGRPEQPGLLIVGDGAPVLARAIRAAGAPAPAEFTAEPGPPDAAVVARLAAGLWTSGIPGLPPVPLYLRAAEARLPDAASR